MMDYQIPDSVSGTKTILAFAFMIATITAVGVWSHVKRWPLPKKRLAYTLCIAASMPVMALWAWELPWLWGVLAGLIMLPVAWIGMGGWLLFADDMLKIGLERQEKRLARARLASGTPADGGAQAAGDVGVEPRKE